MGIMDFKWLRRDVFLPRRRESAPPMPVHNYDPNANREEYLQAFDEFKQRGSLYKQLTLENGNEENESPSSSSGLRNQVTNDTHVKTSKHQPNIQSKSVTTRRFSMPSKITSSPHKSTHQKTNTPNTSVLSENAIYVNEIHSFEEICTNDSFFNNAGESPPKTFYRENSHPFPNATGDMKRPPKPSVRSDIPSDVYKEIVTVLENIVQRAERHNTPVKSINGSGFTSFRQCENVINENFGFLEESQWKNYWGDDEDEDEPENEANNAMLKNLQISSVNNASNHRDTSRHEELYNESMSDHESSEQFSQSVQESDQSNLSLPSKHPVYIIECRSKDIKPKRSFLRNTIITPLELSLGSFRKTTVTLKKCCPRDASSIRLVEEAIERDYEILSKVKHPNIIILMAACFHKKLVNHMTLILEPVDCTLNYFVHQMGRNFSVLESVSIVQQIGNAALYLQECGYIHSNISSHNILVREHPWSVKLTSFELATDIDCSAIQAEIEVNYLRSNTSQLVHSEQGSAQQSAAAPDEKNMSLQEQYVEISKHQPPTEKSSANSQPAYMSVPSKYLIYDTTYRQRLSLHNLTAPEMLTSDQFVFPTAKTDVYSLCLVLWEILNKCVPFVVYSKVDMERMIASKKLNLPFFERERCKPFLNIFHYGLAVNLEHRIIDVHQLIFKLDAIELKIRSEYNEERPNVDNLRQNESHIYENIPPCGIASTSVCQEPLNEHLTNGNESVVLLPSLLDFNKSLTERERTSTRKLKKKATRPSVNQIREMFLSSLNRAVDVVDDVDDVDDVEEEVEVEESFFGDLNESFQEEDDESVFDEEDDQLKENLIDVANDIHRNILNNTTNQPNKSPIQVTAPSLVKESERPLNMSKQSRKIGINLSAKNNRLVTPPAVVGFSVKAHRLNESKTLGNILETDSTSGAKRSLFNSKVDPSVSDYRLSFGNYQLPDTPIARQNYILRNAWLSNQNPGPSNGEKRFERMMNQNGNGDVTPANDDKKLNVSVRIVHNKITPKKDDNGRPSILSKIQFFNSANETPKAEAPVLYDNPITPVKTDDISSNINSPTEPANIFDDRIADEAFEPSDNNNFMRSGTFSNEQQTIMKDLKASISNFGSHSLNQPQKQQSFENKLWKRELDICNRSLCSTDGGNESKVITPKWRSVRDTIMKFEKQVEFTTAPVTTPTESIPKTSTTSQQHRKLGDSPTLIKRTVYSESILSGVDFVTLDNQMPKFNQFNLHGQKVATRVSLRQIRQRSSDCSAERRPMSGTTDVRHTICGSEIELLSFNAGSLNSSMEAGAACPIVKYVCFQCASKMSAEEIKAFTCEPVHTKVNSATNTLEEYPIRRCQALIATQNTRSIEDLYIDDDFDHGLGANMELQSECSDFFDYDMVSNNFFGTKNYDAIENDVGK